MPSPAACGHQAQEARCFKWLLVRRAAQQAAFWSGEPSIAKIVSPGTPSASKTIDQKVFPMPSPACRCTKAGLERLRSGRGRGERHFGHTHVEKIFCTMHKAAIMMRHCQLSFASMCR